MERGEGATSNVLYQTAALFTAPPRSASPAVPWHQVAGRDNATTNRQNSRTTSAASANSRGRIIPCICAAADASTVTPTCSHPNRQKKPGSVALTCPAPAINQSFRTFTPTSLLTGLYPYHPRHLPPPLLGPFQGLVPVYKNAYYPDFQAA